MTTTTLTKHFFFGRFLKTLLIGTISAGLVLPSPALALRPSGVEGTGLEELRQTLGVQPTTPSHTAPVARSAAGMEEDTPEALAAEVLRNIQWFQTAGNLFDQHSAARQLGDSAARLAHRAGASSPTLIQAISALMSALGAQDRERRKSAALGLAELGPAAEAAVPALILVLQHDGDSGVRAEAAHALGKIFKGIVVFQPLR